MKIIITGGAGMVGSHCAQYFAKKKHKIVVIDNLMRSKIFGSDSKSVEYNWRYLKTIKNVKLIKKDARNFSAMLKIFKEEKPDVVIHAAGQPGVRFSIDDPLEDYSINATGTINVAEALRQVNKNGILLYTSTNKVYGDNVNSLPIKQKKNRYEFKNSKGISENFSIDLTGHTPYGVSKLAGDLYVQDYAYAYGLKCGVFRMSCIYGTRQFGFEDQGWLAWFSSRFFQGKPITIYGDGKQIRDVLWVEDLAKAFEAFIQSKLKSEVFNMGGGVDNTISLLELIDTLEDISGKKVKIKYDDWRKFDQKVYVSDIAKAKRLLKWKPSISPEEGVKKLYEWVEGNPKLF
ncbi:UDP-glucose 4-epimerase [hydrothermal vent metagenome]|uniref:UDP-glucose 4-epimerase n=1 Tax=hydrothermal vent metagenome TaxID=652676 RepID=A0A3B1D5S2_9ZZZZ